MSYLNSGQAQAVNEAMSALHNFFAKKNTFFAIKGKEKTIVTSSSNHNAFFANSSTNSEVVKTLETGIFNARAYYLNKNTNLYDVGYAGSSLPVNAQVAENKIKIITDETGKYFIEGVKKIQWDGEMYEIKSTPKRHGLFQNNFHTYFLEESR